MHISDYFDEVNNLIVRYSSAGLIVSSDINFDARSYEQGYIRADVTFVDRSFLHFREFISIEHGKAEKLSGLGLLFLYIKQLRIACFVFRRAPRTTHHVSRFTHYSV